jgi:hypothetical protein
MSEELKYIPKYDETYSIIVAIREHLENTAWAVGKILTKDQIIACWQNSENNNKIFPRVVLSIVQKDWVDLNANEHVVLTSDIKTDQQLWKMGDFDGTLQISIYAETPVQRSYVINAIKDKFLNYDMSGVTSYYINVPDYITNRSTECKLLLRRYKCEDNERSVITKTWKAIVEIDCHMPILKVFSKVLMLPDYDLYIDGDPVKEDLPVLED